MIDLYPEEGGTEMGTEREEKDGKSMAPLSSSSDIYRLPKKDSVLSGHSEGYTKPFPRRLPWTLGKLGERHVG